MLDEYWRMMESMHARASAPLKQGDPRATTVDFPLFLTKKLDT